MSLLEKPEVVALEQEYKTLPVLAQEIHVVDEPSLLTANELLRRIKTGRKKLDELCDPVNAAAHKTWKEGLALKDKLDAPFAAAEKWLKPQIGFYFAELKRLKDAEEKRLRDEEAKAKRDAEQKKKDAETKLAQAAEAESKGEMAEAKKLMDEAVGLVSEAAPAEKPITRPISAYERPKLEGTAVREVWAYRIADEKLIPREYLIPDTAAITKVVNALKDKTNIPGIEAYRDWGKGVATRART